LTKASINASSDFSPQTLHLQIHRKNRYRRLRAPTTRRANEATPELSPLSSAAEEDAEITADGLAFDAKKAW
jgi:hypothetical protein